MTRAGASLSEAQRRRQHLTRVAALITAAWMLPGFCQWIWLSIKQAQFDQRLRALDEQERQLSTQQARLEQDPVYVEGLIRSTFKHAKPGEMVIVPAAAPKRD